MKHFAAFVFLCSCCLWRNILKKMLNYNMPYRTLLLFLLFTFAVSGLAAQEDEPKKLSFMRLTVGKAYYSIYYKDFKPDDVPQEAYDGLWEVQKEVIENFTYDYEVLRGKKRHQYLTTKEEFYEHGRGVCENYADFFILLAREKNLTENLYKVSGNRSGGGHAWLEYRTTDNVYIIDPTWSDDYAYKTKPAREKFRESRAYGREAFFITYAEDKIIFRQQGYNHSSYTSRKSEYPLFNKTPTEESKSDESELEEWEDNQEEF